MRKTAISCVSILLLSMFWNSTSAAQSYLLEIVCKNHNGVTYNRAFTANDDMDAQNKARALLASGEFQSKGECSIKNLKRG